MGGEEIRRRLSRLAGKPVALTITDNRCSMVYVTPGRSGSVKVRLHHMFLLAPPDVLRSVAQFIRRPTVACRQNLNAYVRQNRHLIGGAPRERAALNLSHRGFHYNLKEIYDRVNQQYFDGLLKVTITWGRSRSRARRHSIDFGCYDPSLETIRINPALDRPWVPRIFLDYVVYHEMLHAWLGIREANGRREVHTPEFLEEERAFRFYNWALRWERANLWRFLRAA